jgi:hypothetical protein
MRANPLTRVSLANVGSRVDNVSAAVMVYLLFLVAFLAFVSTHS